MRTEKRIIKCKLCDSVINVWSDGVVINAWQKNDINSYEYKCQCGRKGILKIPIDK